ncbi:MAG: hypothetical protein AAF267_06420 [Deinococcota bacterium]
MKKLFIAGCIALAVGITLAPQLQRPTNTTTSILLAGDGDGDTGG